MVGKPASAAGSVEHRPTLSLRCGLKRVEGLANRVGLADELKRELAGDRALVGIAKSLGGGLRGVDEVERLVATAMGEDDLPAHREPLARGGAGPQVRAGSSS